MGKKFYLEALNEKYLKLLLDWRNSDRVRQSMFTNHLIEWKEHIKWFDKIKNNNPPTHHLFFYDQKPVGFVCFTDTVQNGSSNWGFYMGDSTENGVSYLMGISALNFGFNQLSLNKIYGHVISSNQKSLRYHIQLGFAEETFFETEEVLENETKRHTIIYGYEKASWLNQKKIVILNLQKIFNKPFFQEMEIAKEGL